MTDQAKPPGLAAVQTIMAGAREITAEQLPAESNDDHDPGGTPIPPDQPPAEPIKGKVGLPPDFPIVPLGVNGGYAYYLDANNQMRGLKDKEHGRLGIQMLMGPHIDLLYHHWPKRISREGKVKTWAAEEVAEALMASAARRGVWDIFGRTRGPGAWLGEHGELVLHLGDQLIRSEPPGEVLERQTRLIAERPGMYGRFVYPAGMAQPKPAEHCTLGGARGAADDLLDLLQTWNWRRGAIDAHLMLGWICAAIVGGALAWRPLAWVTGDRATGKSTLQDLLQRLLGDSLVSVAEATPAGIWQKLGHASLPVAFDELEAEEDNRRANSVIKLARLAASGALMLRGGADHNGMEFVARSCFLFSSILLPPLQTQDLSRMAILELDALTTAKPPPLNPAVMADLGAGLRRKLLDEWPRFEQTLALYRHALASEGGHGGRGADQFGTLLACADLALSSGLPDSDSLAGWAEKLKASRLSETRDAQSDHEKLVEQLMTTIVDAWRGGTKASVGQLIAQASGRGDATAIEQVDAAAVLGTYGMRYVNNGIGGRAPGEFIAFANSHQGLAGLLEHSHWGKRSGSTGVWVQSLSRIAGARRGHNLRFGGVAARCVLVPLDQVLLPSDEDGEAVD